MASHPEGFYDGLHSFSTADEWNVLRLRSVVRKRKSEVFQVEFILGERNRKVCEFPLFLCTRCKLIYTWYNSSNLFICVPGAESARVSSEVFQMGDRV